MIEFIKKNKFVLLISLIVILLILWVIFSGGSDNPFNYADIF